MGLLPTPNHVALIRDCYVQPHTSTPPSAQAPLPQPASNALSKLTFYAVNRPAKIPKVVANLVERASKARASSGLKARQDLAVTVDIVRGLVVETGESGKDGAGELIKGAIAEDALRVAEMALGGEGGGADVFSAAKVRGGKRDPEMEARGASLFHAVATFLTPPFLGASDSVGRQYLRCLSLLSAIAQLAGAGNAQSRFVALKALNGAARSEYLYSTGSDYDSQVEELVPALLRNCLDADVDDLREHLASTLSDKSLTPHPASLSSRKASSISLPEDSSKLPTMSSLALPTVLLLSRLSTVPQLLSLHASFASFLDQHDTGALWHAPSQPLVLFLARALLAAAQSGHRAPILAWWSDQAGEIYERDTQHRSVTLLFLLQQLLDPSAPDAPHSEDVAVEGLSAGGVLNTLAELLVRRARLSSPAGTPSATRESSPTRTSGAVEDPDPLLRPILAVVAALARSSALRGYPSQLDDLVSDVVDLLRALKLEEGRAERLVAGMSAEEKSRARVRVVMALRTLLEEAPGGAPSMSEGDAHQTAAQEDADFAAPARQNGAGTSVEELDLEAIRLRPPIGAPADSNGTIRAKAAPPLTAAPGLVLGKPINGAADVFSLGGSASAQATVRAKKTTPPPAPLEAEQPILRVSTPGGASATPSSTRSRVHSASRSSPSRPSATPQRQAVAPRTFARSLFLLTEPDVRLRIEYAAAAGVYVARELPLASVSSSISADELAAFWRQLHAAAYGLAIGEISSSPATAATNGASEPQHALHRARSARSLRSQHSKKSFLEADSPPAPASSRSAPAAADYAALAALLESVPRAPAAVLEGVPALLALDAKAAARWEVGLAGGGELGGEGGGADPARAQACREVAARGWRAVGRAWGLRELEELGQEALDALSPSVVPAGAHPSSPFAARPTAAPAALNASLVIDILATDAGLQRAAQLDRTSLASLLAQPWSYSAAVVAASASRSPYLASALPSRSLVNLSPSRAGSTFRLASAASPHHSPSPLHTGSLTPSSRSRRWGGGAPSLADLQAGLSGGSGFRSARTSAAPSVVSSVGGGSELGAGGRRRTSRATPETVLERVGRRSRAGTGASAVPVHAVGGAERGSTL
ncbi:plasma membrane localization protein [Rhodotorula kratochvilovae]